MRSGPNQYWSTVEFFGSDRTEVLRGANGVLHGADAVGGIVNSLSSDPYFSDSEKYRWLIFSVGFHLQSTLE